MVFFPLLGCEFGITCHLFSLLEEDIAHSRRVIQMHRVERTIIRTGLPLGILLLGAFLFLLLSEFVM